MFTVEQQSTMSRIVFNGETYFLERQLIMPRGKAVDNARFLQYVQEHADGATFDVMKIAAGLNMSEQGIRAKLKKLITAGILAGGAIADAANNFPAPVGGKTGRAKVSPAAAWGKFVRTAAELADKLAAYDGTDDSSALLAQDCANVAAAVESVTKKRSK